MEFTNEEMVKSLTSLIDETLEEIEEIKKSKFAASEISLGDDKSGIADKSKNGKLEAKKAEDEDEEDEDEEDEDSDDMDKADWAEKSDCMDKAEDEDEEDEDEEDEDEEDEDEEKMSKGMGSQLASKKELKFPSKKELKAAKKPDAEGKKLAAKMAKPLKKSEEEETSLMKSYVDERFSSLEKTISKLAAAVEAIADTPVQRKGVPAGVTALHKSSEEVEPLSKSEVANKLFELKKTGKSVDSADIFKVETGNNLTVIEIANKYGLR